jgi:Fungal specific transcription factor domain
LRLKWIQTEPQKGKQSVAQTPHFAPVAHSQFEAAAESDELESDSSESIVAQESPPELLQIQPYRQPVRKQELPLLNYPARSNTVVVNRSHETDFPEPFNDEYGIDPGLTLYSLPEFLQDSSARHLLHHYDQAVAGTMVWFDGTENPWRNTMLPMAIESPSLLLSILGLAAEHLHARMRANNYSSASHQSSLMLSRNYREKGLELLARELQDEVRTGNNFGLARRGPANSTLATILFQCYCETVHPGSALWRVHLQAARTMIRSWMSMPQDPRLADSTTRFLMREVFVIDAFATTTMFDDDEVLEGAVPDSKDCSIFTEFLQVIRDVTAMERLRHKHLVHGQTTTAYDINILQAKFDYTRSRSFRFAKTLDFGSESLRSDFTRIIEIFHHAGLVYSYQALIEPEVSEMDRAYSLETLFDTLRCIPDSPTFAQDIVWPLFIAGTECRERYEDQQWIEKKLKKTMQSTGFSNCQPALEFLQIFWATDSVTVGTWLSYAREYSKLWPTFLVY